MIIYKRRFKEDSIPKAPAYWIDPLGRILPIFNDAKHIDQIMLKPKAFGLDIDEIKTIYDAEGESLGSEGKAREKIIKELIQQGWIRIRHYDRQDIFTVNVFRLNKKNKDYLYQWAKAMENNGMKYSQVKLDLPNQVLNYSISDIAKDVLFNECKNSKPLIAVESVDDLPDMPVKSLFKRGLIMEKYKRITEKSPKILKSVLYGIYEYAKTFGIMTAENPMGKKISREENHKRRLEFYDLLKNGRFQYVKLKGKYGNVEDPVLIINIPKKELLYYGNLYVQESVIYGEILEYNKVNFEYWKRDNENSPLKFLDSIDHIDLRKDAKDFYSWIKNFKFTIPFPIFKESLEIWYKNKILILNENEKSEIKTIINEIVENDEKKTGHHFYRLRGNFNRIVNLRKMQNEKI